MTSDQLLGPLGLTAALLLAVAFLAREGLKFIRQRMDELEEDLKVALQGWQEQTRANQTLANAQEARNRDDELRNRLKEAGK